MIALICNTNSCHYYLLQSHKVQLLLLRPSGFWIYWGYFYDVVVKIWSILMKLWKLLVAPSQCDMFNVLILSSLLIMRVCLPLSSVHVPCDLPTHTWSHANQILTLPNTLPWFIHCCLLFCLYSCFRLNLDLIWCLIV